MEKDKDGYYEFTLMHSGVSAISGICYPEPVLAELELVPFSQNML
jgi:hypothetical protein